MSYLPSYHAVSTVSDGNTRTGMLAFAYVLVCMLALTVLTPSMVFAQEEPTTKKFRLIYVQGDSYSDFKRVFRGFAMGLERLHLVHNGNVPIPDDSESVEYMWKWMRENADSSTVEFLADGFYSAEYDEQKMQDIVKEIKHRIDTRNDVDAILSFGTLAGRYISKLDTSVPIIFSSITDAVAAKIVPSRTDSGKDNHVAVVIPDIDVRNIQVFHSIFNFKKMGIAYDDTPNGRDSVALSEIEKAAKELNIELVRCNDTFETADLELASDRLAACNRKLVDDGVDSVFVTTAVDINPKYAEKIFEPIIKAKIPCFSQLGSSDVKLGALMSISETNTLEEGAYSAELLHQIMLGKKPRSLRQIFSPYVAIAINIHTAVLIGWNPPIETLLVVDEFYY